MIDILLALAGLALNVTVPAQAAERARPAASKPSTLSKPSKPSKPASSEAKPELSLSAAATRVVDWIAASGDNGALPYIVIDKNNAALFLFDAKGKSLGTAPVLIGVAIGDEATPGIGSKNLAEIGPAEKTTPAGRFLAKYGLAAGRQKVLWVDYATSVALHPIPTGYNPKERRRERMLSPTSDDNRITFGCINVPLTFYTRNVQPLFRKKGGYVYILPDTRPLEAVFPSLWVRPAVSAAAP
jgi:hypothetical protein